MWWSAAMAGGFVYTFPALAKGYPGSNGGAARVQGRLDLLVGPPDSVPARRRCPTGTTPITRPSRSTTRTVRRPDPRIGAQLLAALGDARTVLNIGAGTGSYEPTDRHVVAVEPAAEMRAKRDPALRLRSPASPNALPFDDDAFDAAPRRC